MKKYAPYGLTLLEIIISAVILSIIAVGIGNIFVTGKGLIQHSRSRMAGGELGRVFIDPLHMLVRQDTWNVPASNTFFPGTSYCDGDPVHAQQQNCPPLLSRTLHGIVYSAQYDISDLTDATGSPLGLRKVLATISWVEPRQ
jgi:prepilin-type N-terminal cleavage/methylation domain-containing protein